MAAQCIHQIRNRIEALRDPESSFVLMISSPFQGDGKTSLATTLGWSYSLAGHRTLMIDCDFIGHGLTHEARVSDREGLRDLIAQRNLGDQIVSLPAENLEVTDFRGASGIASGSSYAVPRLAALAARILEETPELTAMDLKARILARAKPSPFEETGRVAAGWIADPMAD